MCPFGADLNSAFTLVFTQVNEICRSPRRLADHFGDQLQLARARIEQHGQCEPAVEAVVGDVEARVQAVL
jgi:hypothetical protein